MAQSKFEQEMYDEAYKVASYLRQTGQDSVFLRLVKEKGSRFFWFFVKKDWCQNFNYYF